MTPLAQRRIELNRKPGFVLHEGETAGEPFVVIATLRTENRKAAGMIQTWFLLKNHHPVDVVNSGLDASTVCRGCPFASKNGCYVNVGQAPRNVWKSYHKGNYPALDPKDYNLVFEGKKVRFGAYGNPSLLPLSKVKAIAGASAGWTGYFHDWRDMHPSTRKAYGQYFMASTETAESYQCATEKGLRTFHVSPEKPKDALECLNTSQGITCDQCRLCAGLSKKTRSIWIAPHGATKKRAELVATAA